MQTAVVFNSPQAKWKIAGLTLGDRAIRRVYRNGTRHFVVVSPTADSPPSWARPNHYPKAKFEFISEEDFRSRKNHLPHYFQLGTDRIEAGKVSVTVQEKKDLAAASRVFWTQLYRSMRKPNDGWFLNNVNRKISRWITRLLVWTPLTPNQISAAVSLLGMLAGWLVSHGTHGLVALGGLVFQISSVIDAVDGEVAHAKLRNSKKGQWVDTICDNISYSSFLVGVFFGVLRQGTLPYPYLIGLMTFMGLLITLGSMFFYLRRYTDSGSLITVAADLSRDLSAHPENFLARALNRAKFLMKRDFFALFFMTLCLFNELNTILVLACIGVNATWLVLRLVKPEFSSPPIPEGSPDFAR